MSDVTDICVMNRNEDEPIINNNYLIVRIDNDNKDVSTKLIFATPRPSFPF